MDSKNISPKSNYNKDFVKWTKNQANLLKKQDFAHLDIENLVEEIQSLGKSDKRALKSHLIILLLHLLKAEYQPEMRTNSWINSIRNSILEIKLILDDSPSLNNKLEDFIKVAYPYAREKAIIETGLNEKVFPQSCPWTVLDIKEVIKS